MSELAKINGYDIRDKKLADTGTKTTAVNTDYVLLEDTNGNYQKIAKNSFTEAVRNTLGDILRNNDKGTSVNGIPALGSDNDFGSINLSNLASVLGVPTQQEISLMLYKDMEINEEHKFNSYGIYVLTELSISGASCIFTNKLAANADIKIIVDDGALNYF